MQIIVILQNYSITKIRIIMQNIIKKIERIPVRSNIVYLMKELKEISEINIPLDEANIVRMQKSFAEKTISAIHKAEYSLFFYIPKETKNGNKFLEEDRGNRQTHRSWDCS